MKKKLVKKVPQSEKRFTVEQVVALYDQYCDEEDGQAFEDWLRDKYAPTCSCCGQKVKK